MRFLVQLTTVLSLMLFSLSLAPTDVGWGASQENLTDPVSIIKKSQMAFYYPANDMKSKVTMELIAKDGSRRGRVMTMLRRDESDGGNQKYFIYFQEPGDVRGMVFMVWKYPEKEDDRWLFVPSVDLIKRIAADDSRSSFVGSDFTYEDISGRDVSADTHTLLREEKIGDRSCYVIQSIPKKSANFTKRLSWIDKANLLPVKDEYFDAQGQLSQVFSADKVEEIAAGEGNNKQVFPTVTQRTMKNVKTGHRTEVRLSSIAYNVGLKSDDFSERRMRQPPNDWTR